MELELFGDWGSNGGGENVLIGAFVGELSLIFCVLLVFL